MELVVSSLFKKFEPWSSVFKDSGTGDGSQRHIWECKGDPEGLAACMPCRAAYSGHVLSNKNSEWHDSVDTSWWRGKNVLKWTSIYRSFHFPEGIILKSKIILN